MAEILFYHLTETRLEETLPSLLEKSLERGWRACIHCGSDEAIDALDAQLWTYRNDSFLAHGKDDMGKGDMGKDGVDNAQFQPILLTKDDTAKNNAEVRFVVEMGPEPDVATCERIVYMFDGHDQSQLERARGQWKAFSSGGIEKTYWQQTPERRWIKKA